MRRGNQVIGLPAVLNGDYYDVICGERGDIIYRCGVWWLRAPPAVAVHLWSYDELQEGMRKAAVVMKVFQ